MVKVRILRGNEYQYITLQEMLNIYYKEAPQGWFQFIEDEIEGAMKIKTEKEYEEFIEKHKHLFYFMRTKFDPNELSRFYNVLKNSKYAKMFDDDILKYISYIRELSFFNIINYSLDKDNPNLDDWLNSNNPFKFGYTEEEVKNAYSMMDLLPLKYGMNAIRGQLLKANKKIY